LHEFLRTKTDPGTEAGVTVLKKARAHKGAGFFIRIFYAVDAIT